MNDTISYSYKADRGTMYFHQSMHQMEKDDFIKAIIQEFIGN